MFGIISRIALGEFLQDFWLLFLGVYNYLAIPGTLMSPCHFPTAAVGEQGLGCLVCICALVVAPSQPPHLVTDLKQFC